MRLKNKQGTLKRLEYLDLLQTYKQSRVGIRVPYKEDYVAEIKKIGAYWDPVDKFWYVPERLENLYIKVVMKHYTVSEIKSYQRKKDQLTTTHSFCDPSYLREESEKWSFD